MADEPLPEGSRNVPPSRARIALGQGDHGPHEKVIVDVSDPAERNLVADAFERIGFETIVAEDAAHAIFEIRSATGGILITDDMQLIQDAAAPYGQKRASRWKFLALCVDNRSAVEFAEQCGADAVMFAPLPEKGEAIIEWFK